MREVDRPTPEEISAYLDGELDPVHQTAISIYLSTDPEAAQEVARQRSIKDGLQALNRPDELNEDVPASALQTLSSLKGSQPSPTPASGAKSRRPALVLAGAAVATLLLIVSILPTDVLRQPAPQTDIAADVLYFLDLGEGSAEFGPQDQDTILRTLVGFEPDLSDTPRLRQAGFTFTGGRVIANRGEGAVLLFYTNRQDAPIGLFVSSPPQAPVVPTEVIFGEAHVAFWRQESLSFTAVGRVSPDRLRMFQMAFQGQ